MAFNQARTDLIKEFEGRDYTALNRRLVVARSCTKHCLPLSPNQDNPAVSTAFGFAAGATGLFHHVVQNCVLAVFFNEQGNRHLGAMATGAVKQNMVVGHRLQFSHANECRASGRARSSHCFHSRLTDQIRLIQYHCYASGYPPCASGSGFYIQ